MVRPGERVLVVGNHDITHEALKDAGFRTQYIAALYDAGFRTRYIAALYDAGFRTRYIAALYDADPPLAL